MLPELFALFREDFGLPLELDLLAGDFDLLADDFRLLAELDEPLDLFDARLGLAAGFFAFAGFAFVELVRAFDLLFFEAVFVSAIRLSSSCGFPPNPSSPPIRSIQNRR